MRIILTAFAIASVAISGSAAAAPADDATAFIGTVMDAFNKGDAKAFVAAHENNAVIVDDFGQHVWTGPNTAQHWFDDFTKMMTATATTGGRMDYGKPIQATSDGASAYVVLPTTYHYAAKGAKMAEAGTMTVVLKREGSGWKIASWAYAQGPAAPDK